MVDEALEGRDDLVGPEAVEVGDGVVDAHSPNPKTTDRHTSRGERGAAIRSGHLGSQPPPGITTNGNVPTEGVADVNRRVNCPPTPAACRLSPSAQPEHLVTPPHRYQPLSLRVRAKRGRGAWIVRVGDATGRRPVVTPRRRWVPIALWVRDDALGGPIGTHDRIGTQCWGPAPVEPRGG